MLMRTGGGTKIQASLWLHRLLYHVAESDILRESFDESSHKKDVDISVDHRLAPAYIYQDGIV